MRRILMELMMWGLPLVIAFAMSACTCASEEEDGDTINDDANDDTNDDTDDDINDDDSDDDAEG